MQLPRFLDLRRLQGRIVALFLGLLLAVQLLSYGVISRYLERNAEHAITQELRTGERVYKRLLQQDGQQHRDAATLLEADHGFREVLAGGLESSDQRNTLASSLDSHQERVGASLVAYLDARRRLVAATRPDAADFIALLPSAGSNAGTQADDGLSSLVLVRGQPYQLISLPVRAAGLGGRVVMAFALEQRSLLELQSISKLKALLLLRQADGTWHGVASVLEPAATEAVARQLGSMDGMSSLRLDGEQFSALAVPLRESQGQTLDVVLLRSFDEAVAPFRQLQRALLLLDVAGVLVFALGSVLTARRISEPVIALSESARRLGAGDYDSPVSRERKDEIGDLAESFESMRLGIREREEQVHRLAFWDPLTGLPNREQFSQQLQQRLAQSEQAFAVLMLDLDRFKHVNDVLGHRFGDQLLCGVAERLRDIGTSSHCQLARLGGDEFVLLLDPADEAGAQALAQRIQRNFEQPLQIEEQTVDIGASIGIVLHPQQGREASQLLSRAELAMYAAKRRQSGSQLYSPALDASSQESLSLLGELRRAVEENQLRLYLQPKVDLRTGRVCSAEALVRWEHPQRGLVPPMQFIPFAEQTGFIRSLSSWVLAASARAWAQAHAAGVDLRISVNLSTRDLLDQDLPMKIKACVDAQRASPQSLCLEITESAIMDDPARALSTLEQLSAMGFKLSIDDFGTGYSSLAYLKRLPVDELKIDKSFVMAMERDLDDAKIVRSTIELAHNLGLSVVAEGLETAKAWQLLAALGCDEGQGFYIAKPMPEAQFMHWLSQWRRPQDSETEVPATMFSRLE